jgi:DNA-binding transcriptional ArsR family regulator
MSSLALDGYIVRTLMPDLVGHDRQASAFVVYLFLWERTASGRQRNVPISLRVIAEGTGLSKRAVQTSLAVLVRRHLVTARRDGPTSVPEYTVQRPWARRAGGGRRPEGSE